VSAKLGLKMAGEERKFGLGISLLKKRGFRKRVGAKMGIRELHTKGTL